MAIAFRSLTSTTYASRTNNTLTAPSGLANDDILIAAVVTVSSSPVAVSAASGFTQIGTYTEVTDAGGADGRMYLFWKRAASESGSYTFNHSSASSQGLMRAYSGCITTGSPIDTSSTAIGSNQTTVATGITTSVNDAMLLFTAHDWEGIGTLSPPSGMTERFDSLLYAADVIQSTAGASGNKSQTNGNGGNPAYQRWAASLIALKPATGGSGISGTASITEAADSVASTGKLAINGSASITEAADTLSSSGKVALIGSASITEAADTVSSAGKVSITGAASITEAADTATATGKIAISGQAGITEDADTLSATGESTVTGSGSASITEDADTVSASATLAIKGQASLTEAGDTLAGTGTLPITGASSITEGDDTLSATANLAIVGSASLTEAADTLAAEGVTPPSQPVLAQANITEASDTVVAFGARPNDRQPGGFMPVILVDRNGRPVNLKKKANEVLTKARAVAKELPKEEKQDAKEAIRDLAAAVTVAHVRELQDALAGADKVLDRVMAELARIAEEAEDEDDVEFLLLAS